jgi:MoxR-like ATPase
VLTDEINRAPAKEQSALLEVMAEKQVSIGGQTRPLPSPFLVLATQNPVESEGVYTLPEAQRDRFLMKVTVGYPSPTEELEIVRRMGVSPPSASQAMTLDDLQVLQNTADQVYVDAGVAQYAVDLVMATREPAERGLPELAPLIDFGVSPRATLGLIAAGRGLALMRGRSYVVPQDVFDVTRDVFRHRLMLSYEALAKNLDADDVINRVLSMVAAAEISPVQQRRVDRATGNGSVDAGPAPAAPADRNLPPVPAATSVAPPPAPPARPAAASSDGARPDAGSEPTSEFPQP